MIRGDGFSGIVAITWAVEYRRRMRGRSSGGRQFGDMSRRSRAVVSPVIQLVGHGNAKHYFIGPMTAVNFDRRCPWPRQTI